MYEVIGNDALISEGQRALSALRELVSDDLSISEIEICENTPIQAILTDDIEHHRYVWAPSGWVNVTHDRPLGQ